jgi:membrane-associated HD superfamily phosphohydrolase
MDWQHLFGNFAMLCGLAMVFFGIPSQIIKNRREKRCGVPLASAVLSFFVFLSRICYSMTIKSHYLLIPDSVGIVLAIIVLWQYRKYRAK